MEVSDYNIIAPKYKICHLSLATFKIFSVFGFHQIDYDVSSHRFLFICPCFDSLSFLKPHFWPSSNLGKFWEQTSFVLQICILLFFSLSSFWNYNFKLDDLTSSYYFWGSIPVYFQSFLFCVLHSIFIIRYAICRSFS